MVGMEDSVHLYPNQIMGYATTCCDSKALVNNPDIIFADDQL